MASFIRINGKYRVTIRRKGWKAITKTFDREADAESWSTKIERQIDEGKKVGIHGKTGMTLADAINRYLNRYLAEVDKSITYRNLCDQATQ